MIFDYNPNSIAALIGRFVLAARIVFAQKAK
jgi:hypothetical protein